MTVLGTIQRARRELVRSRNADCAWLHISMRHTRRLRTRDMVRDGLVAFSQAMRAIGAGDFKEARECLYWEAWTR